MDDLKQAVRNVLTRTWLEFGTNGDFDEEAFIERQTREVLAAILKKAGSRPDPIEQAYRAGMDAGRQST